MQLNFTTHRTKRQRWSSYVLNTFSCNDSVFELPPSACFKFLPHEITLVQLGYLSRRIRPEHCNMRPRYTVVTMPRRGKISRYNGSNETGDNKHLVLSSSIHRRGENRSYYAAGMHACSCLCTNTSSVLVALRRTLPTIERHLNGSSDLFVIRQRWILRLGSGLPSIGIVHGTWTVSQWRKLTDFLAG